MQLPSRIILGVSAGIAAYKAPALIRLLRKQGSEVRVVLTPHARPFVGEEALRTVSENSVYTDSDSHSSLLYSGSLDHIRLADWGECLLVAPATANTVAKLAHGFADNLLTTLALSFEGQRLVVAPAMNTRMWDNAATRHNIELLQARGARVLPVGSGELACGTEGPGRMIEIEQIVGSLRHHLAKRFLTGKRVLVSAGGTCEPIDPVRVISNRSSGKMGAAIAEVALALGAEVTMVAGSVTVPMPSGARVLRVATAAQMKEALEPEFSQCDICIMAAAVCDFRPKVENETKIHRADISEPSIDLVANPDILRSLGTEKDRQFLVGFALEDREGVDRAVAKMKQKNCDLMVLNTPEESLEKDTTTVSLLSPDSEIKTIGPLHKVDAAYGIWHHIAKKLELQ